MGENFIIIAQQVLVLFILIAVGFICGKKKIITDFSARHMTDIVLYVVTPCVMISAFQREFSFELLSGLIICVACSALIFAVSILICNLIFHDKDESRKAVIRFATIYSNCAFMCIPLINGIYGSEGVLYLTAYLTFFNVLIWTHGLMTMKGERDFSSLVKALISPSVIAVVVGLICYLTNVRLPKVPATALQYIADMNTPIAMVIAGATAAQTNVLKALQNRRIYYVSLCKLLILPVAGFFAMWILDPPPIVLMTVTIAAACPAATMCTMFAVNLDKDPKTASEIFTITTILSAVTLPLITIFADRLTYHI